MVPVPPDPPPADDADDVPPVSPADFFPEVTAEEGRRVDAETLVIAERRLAVVRLYRRGLSMKAIAAQVKCAPSTVHHDIHAVLDGWKRIAARTARDHVADMLQRLTDREYEIEQDLERSRGELVETVGGRRVLQTGSVDSTTVKKKTRYGDPRLHALLIQCWQKRCELLGLLKPGELEGRGVAVKLVSGIDPAELV